MADDLVAAARAIDERLLRAGQLTAHAVWAQLAAAGCIPADWPGSRARRFRRARRRRLAPHTAWDALTYAALAEQIPALEALARETVVRLRPWCAPGASTAGDAATVFWRTAAPELDRRAVCAGAGVRDALAALGRALAALADARGFPLDPVPTGHYWPHDPQFRLRQVRAFHARCAFADLPASTAEWQRWWHAAADARCTAAAAGAVHGLAPDAPLATLPDPFAPLRELLARGVVPSCVSANGLEVYTPMLPGAAAPDLAARWRTRRR